MIMAKAFRSDGSFGLNFIDEKRVTRIKMSDFIGGDPVKGGKFLFAK